MLSETLTDGLNRYKIGQKVRNMRLDKKLALTELGDHTGLSTAMLSKIERGQLFPTLPTLLRIALVFGIGLDHFFVERPTKRLVSVARKGERIRLPDQVKEFPPSYLFESLDFAVTDRKMDAFLATFPAQSKRSKPHHHDGVSSMSSVGRSSSRSTAKIQASEKAIQSISIRLRPIAIAARAAWSALHSWSSSRRRNESGHRRGWGGRRWPRTAKE